MPCFSVQKAKPRTGSISCTGEQHRAAAWPQDRRSSPNTAPYAPMRAPYRRSALVETSAFLLPLVDSRRIIIFHRILYMNCHHISTPYFKNCKPTCRMRSGRELYNSLPPSCSYSPRACAESSAYAYPQMAQRPIRKAGSPPQTIARPIAAAPLLTAGKVCYHRQQLLAPDTRLKHRLRVAAHHIRAVCTDGGDTMQHIRAVLPPIQHHVSSFGLGNSRQTHSADPVTQKRRHGSPCHGQLRASAVLHRLHNGGRQLLHGHGTYFSRRHPSLLRSMLPSGPISMVGCSSVN